MAGVLRPVEYDQLKIMLMGTITEAIWERTKNVGAKEQMMTKIGGIMMDYGFTTANL